MRDPEELLRSAHAVIDQAVSLTNPLKKRQIAPLLSGGHDSLCAVSVATQHPVFANWGGQVRHINTGIGSKYTRDFVETACLSMGWPLVVHKSNSSYEKFVREKGFPGPGAHQWIYGRLKDRCVYQITKGIKKTILVTGCRQQESVRRMGHVDPVKVGEVYNKATGEISRKNRIWTSPCFDWSKEEQMSYMEEYGLPRNKLKTLIGMSGECFCGAFSQEGEIELIRQHCPDVYEEIQRLQAIAKESCVNRQEWGPRTVRGVVVKTGPMCSSCDYKAYRQGILFEDC